MMLSFVAFLISVSCLLSPQKDAIIKYVGNETLSDSQLIDAAGDELIDLERRQYSKAAVDDIAFTLESHYHSKGYAWATVVYTYEADGDELNITFRVVEGKRVTIDRIDIVGNHHFSDDELVSLLATKRGGLLGVGERYFVRGDIESGSSEIKRVYIENGYLEVGISHPKIDFSADTSKANITIEIKEGVQYKLRRIHFHGHVAVSEDILQNRMAHLLNSPFSPRTPFEIKSALEELYGNRGYADIRVRAEQVETPNRQHVVINIFIVEGVQVFIRDVFVVGNKKTTEATITNRLTLKKGDLYSRNEERVSFNRLFATGLFSSVHMELVGESDLRDLIIEVSELPSIEFSLMPGIGSYERARFEFGFRERNFLGTGRSLRSTIEISTVGVSALAGITDPWILGSGFTLDIPLTYLRRKEPTFTRREVAIEVTLRRQWSPRFSTAFGYQLKNTEAIGDPTEIESEDFDNTFRIGSLRLEPRYDTRNDPFNPGSGALISLTTEYADRFLGSELEFVRSQFTWAQFFTISNSTILALGARTGVIIPLGDTEAIPIQERFFNGGEESVRSFRQSELGPRDSDNDPLGGETRTIFNFELRQRITGNLHGALFLDYGNVGAVREDYLRRFSSAVGPGLRYVLPIGALRVDFAFNPDPRGRDDRFNVQFSVGMAF